MNPRRDDFEQFLQHVEKESAAAGETEALEVYAAHFRRAVATIRASAPAPRRKPAPRVARR